MKILSLLLFFCPMLLLAQETCCPPPSCRPESCALIDWTSSNPNIAVTFRLGNFQPTDSCVKKIFSNALEYELEVNWRQCFYSLDFWVNFNYANLHGHAKCCHQSTSLQLYPLSFGLKHAFVLSDRTSLYVGIGASYTYLHARGRPLFGHKDSYRHGWGAVGKSGLLYMFSRGLFIDLYVDYYYTGVKSHGDTINFGGLRTGAGIGMLF